MHGGMLSFVAYTGEV